MNNPMKVPMVGVMRCTDDFKGMQVEEHLIAGEVDRDSPEFVTIYFMHRPEKGETETNCPWYITLSQAMIDKLKAV